MQGGDGDDLLDGGAGDDGLEGDFGDDTLLGGAGSDNIRGDNFQPGASGDDFILAGAGGDLIWAHGGNDLVNGGSGNDMILGGDGADTMVGGAGADTFLFDLNKSWSTPAAFDLIRADRSGADDFEGAGVAGGDVIDLTLLSEQGELPYENPLVFGGRGLGHVWLGENGARTLVYVDLAGDGAPEFKLAIDDGDVRAGDYTAEDFIL